MARFGSLGAGLAAGVESGLNRLDKQHTAEYQGMTDRHKMSQQGLTQLMNVALKYKEAGKQIPPEIQEMLNVLAKQTDRYSTHMGLGDAGMHEATMQALSGLPVAEKEDPLIRIQNKYNRRDTRYIRKSQLSQYFPEGWPAMIRDDSGGMVSVPTEKGKWNIISSEATEETAPKDERTTKMKDAEAYAEAMGISLKEAYEHLYPGEKVPDTRTQHQKDAQALSEATGISYGDALRQVMKLDSAEPDTRTDAEKKAQAIVAQDPSLKYGDVLKEIVLGKKESDRTKEEKLALALSNADENISFADALKHVTGYDKVEDVPAYSQITLHNPNPPEGEPSWITLDKNTEQTEITEYRKKGYNATTRGVVSPTPGGLTGETVETKAERDRLRGRKDQYLRARRLIGLVREIHERDPMSLGASGGVQQWFSKKLGGLASIAQLLGPGRVEDFVNNTRQWIAEETEMGNMDPEIMDKYFSSSAVERNDLDLLDLYHHSMAAIVARSRQPTDRILASMLQKAMDDTNLIGLQHPDRVVNIYKALDDDFQYQIDTIDRRLNKGGESTGPVTQRLYFDANGNVVGEEGG